MSGELSCWGVPLQLLRRFAMVYVEGPQAKSVEPSVFQTVAKVPAPSMHSFQWFFVGSQDPRKRELTPGPKPGADLELQQLLAITLNLCNLQLGLEPSLASAGSVGPTQYLASLPKAPSRIENNS